MFREKKTQNQRTCSLDIIMCKLQSLFWFSHWINFLPCIMYRLVLFFSQMPAFQPARSLLVWILQFFMFLFRQKHLSLILRKAFEQQWQQACLCRVCSIGHISQHHGTPLQGANAWVPEGVNCNFVQEFTQVIHYTNGSHIMNNIIEITAKSEKVFFRELNCLNCLNTHLQQDLSFEMRKYQEQCSLLFSSVSQKQLCFVI